MDNIPHLLIGGLFHRVLIHAKCKICAGAVVGSLVAELGASTQFKTIDVPSIGMILESQPTAVADEIRGQGVSNGESSSCPGAMSKCQTTP